KVFVPPCVRTAPTVLTSSAVPAITELIVVVPPLNIVGLAPASVSVLPFNTLPLTVWNVRLCAMIGWTRVTVPAVLVTPAAETPKNALLGFDALLIQPTNGPNTSLLDWLQRGLAASQLPVPPLPTADPFASQ